MLVCGLSREVTLAVLPRLYVEELILELGRRNIQTASETSSREDLISLLCDVMIDEYSRGRKGLCLNVQKQHSTGGITREATGQEYRKATPAVDVNVQRRATCVERERRGSGQNDVNFGNKQTRQSVCNSSSSRNEPVQKACTPPEVDDSDDVIIVEDESEVTGSTTSVAHGRQEDTINSHIPAVTDVRNLTYSRPPSSSTQSTKHISTEPPTCVSPNTSSTLALERDVVVQENTGKLDASLNVEELPSEDVVWREVTTTANRQTQQSKMGSTVVQPDSCLTVESTSNPDGAADTAVLMDMETTDYTEAVTGSTGVAQGTSGAGADMPDVVVEMSSSPLEEPSNSALGQENLKSAERPVESLALYCQEVINSGSVRPPGYSQPLPGSSSLSEEVLLSPDTGGRKTNDPLAETVRAEGSSSSDALLEMQQPTCTVTTSEEAMAIWQDLSKRSSTKKSRIRRGGRKAVHRNDSRFTCQECGYRAPCNSALVIHMRRHTGEKPYSCEECPYRTAYKTALVSHLMTHNRNSRPYMCGECGYRAIQKGHLEKHMASHLRHGQKHVSCDDCGYSTVDRVQLDNHVCIHQQEQDKEATALQ